MKETILNYLMDTYAPEAIITYGSYSDGSANAHSDFDALIIAESASTHDASVIGGVTLDVFIYPAEAFEGVYDPEHFIQIHDGVIERDEYGTAEKLKAAVLAYLRDLPAKSEAERRQAVEWCNKMLRRTAREDAEGYYRWHWLLVESLAIYFDLIGRRYFGPKKALRYLAEHDRPAYEAYEAALKAFRRDRLSDWLKLMIARSGLSGVN